MHELDYVFHCPHISLEDRQQLVLKGPLGKANSLAMSNKPFQGLTKNSLIHELNARAIYEGDKKKELEDLLKEELHGVRRVPALLFTSPNKTLESINYAGYEVLGLNLSTTLESTSKIYLVNYQTTYHQTRLLN